MIMLLLLTFYPKPLKNMIYFTFLMLGFLIILLNSFLIYESTGSWLAGSDASFLYERMLNFAESRIIIKNMDSRYIGYTVFQYLAAFPFTTNNFISVLLIKFSNWFIWIYALNYTLKKIKKHFYIDLSTNIFFMILINSIVLWIGLYNFRDIIILSLVTIISVCLLEGKKNWLLIIVLSIILFFFRYFFVILFCISLLITAIILKFNKGRSILKKILLTLIIITFLITFMPNYVYNFLLFLGIDELTSTSILKAIDISPIQYFTNLLTSFFAGNPLKFAYTAIGTGVERAFTVTPLSAFFQFFSYLGNYIILVPFYLIIFTINEKKFNLFEYVKKKYNTKIAFNSRNFFAINTFIYMNLIFFLYTFFYGGIQERIRITILILLFLILIIIFYKMKDKFLLKRIYFISALILLLYIFISPL
jgi:hypothetical protein